MRNLNLLFNKEFYEKLGTDEFKSRDEEQEHIKGDAEIKSEMLADAVFDHSADYRKLVVEGCQRFILKTVYPGLLVGAGNAHGASDIGGSDSDINMGFSFDYVSGQPYIPGSSVKGVLQSHFINRPEAVIAVLNQKQCFKGVDTDVIELLADKIFKHGDIFFDAVVFDGDERSRLLGFDYITHHISATKNPNPIRILKVIPDVRFEFRFKLSKHKIITDDFEAVFDEESLCGLFKELLLLFGAGAKTNVGYGIFEEADDVIAKKRKR